MNEVYYILSEAIKTPIGSPKVIQNSHLYTELVNIYRKALVKELTESIEPYEGNTKVKDLIWDTIPLKCCGRFIYITRNKSKHKIDRKTSWFWGWCRHDKKCKTNHIHPFIKNDPCRFG